MEGEKRLKTLYVDTREKIDQALLDKLKEITKADFKVERKQLELGDFVITDDHGKVSHVVERKSYPDFVASLQPGHMQLKRLQEQTERLASLEKVPYKILLLEGNYQDIDDRMEKAVNTHTVSLILKGIHTVNVRNKNMTVYFLKNLLEKNSGNVHFDAEFGELMISVKKQHMDTPDKLYHGFLQLVPGISLKIAREISSAYPRMQDLREACRLDGKNAIVKIKVKNRAISVRIAEVLCDYLASA